TPCQRRSHRPRHLHRRRIRFHRLPRHRALHAQPRQTHRHLLGRRPTPRQKHRRSPRTHPRRSPRRPHHHRRIRPGLLARQTSRLLAQRHRLAHLHARVLRERRHPRASHPHLRRRQSLRHQGRHPRLPHRDGRRPPAHRPPQKTRIRHLHRPPAHGRLV